MIAFLALAVAGLTAALVPLSRLMDGGELDLPCPWCHHQTAEEDETCPGCGKAFSAR